MSWLEGKNNLNQHYAVVKGIRFRVFRELEAQSGMSQSELLKLVGISRRTSIRRRNGRFNAVESDRIVRILRLFEIARTILEDADRGRRWMMRPNPGLGGERPIDLASTEAGARAVEEGLLRIEHGVYA